MKLPKEILLSELLNYSVKGNMVLNYGTGENFDIAFNVRYLLEGLKVIASENVLLKCNIATTPAVFVPEDNLNSFTYLVMPVQVRS